MLKLSDFERTAIDLVLDRAVVSSQSLSSAATSAGGSANTLNTSPVQRLLSLLGELPVQEPPSDLVIRTLARIEQSTSGLGTTPSFISSLTSHPAQ